MQETNKVAKLLHNRDFKFMHEEQIAKLRNIIDSIYEQNSIAKIATIGDFNSNLNGRTSFDNLKQLTLFYVVTFIFGKIKILFKVY